MTPFEDFILGDHLSQKLVNMIVRDYISGSLRNGVPWPLVNPDCAYKWVVSTVYNSHCLEAILGGEATLGSIQNGVARVQVIGEGDEDRLVKVAEKLIQIGSLK